MKKVQTRKHMTQEAFDTIRGLIDLNIKPAKIAEIVDRSVTTVERVRACKTFPEYQAFVKAFNEQYRKPQTTVSEAVDKQTEKTERTELDVLLNIETLLMQSLADFQSVHETVHELVENDLLS